MPILKFWFLFSHFFAILLTIEMFSGIIKEIGTVLSLAPFQVTLTDRSNLVVGASVAVNGVCLTVTAMDEAGVTFDLSQETKRITTLGSCQVGDKVNLERALRYGEEVGGHLVSGHVSGVVKLLERGELFRFSCPSSLRPYLFYKGYVALNGVSLTIAELTTDTFAVALIAETLKRTTFGILSVGTPVNIEWDQLTYATVETTKNILNRDPGEPI